MVLDGLRGYIQLANGLTDVTRARARDAAKSLLAQGEASVGVVVPSPVLAQVGALADDLIATSKANRALFLHLVRSEVERSVARLGLVSADELSAATRRSKAMERRIEELEQELRRTRATKKATAKKATAKKATARTTGGRKSTAKKSTAKKATARTTGGRKSTAKKSPAKKSATKSAVKRSTS